MHFPLPLITILLATGASARPQPQQPSSSSPPPPTSSTTGATPINYTTDITQGGYPGWEYDYALFPEPGHPPSVILQFSDDCKHTSNQDGISSLGVTVLVYGDVGACCPMGRGFLDVGVQRGGCEVLFHAEQGCTDVGLNTTEARVQGCTKVDMWEGYTVDCGWKGKA